MLLVIGQEAIRGGLDSSKGPILPSCTGKRAPACRGGATWPPQKFWNIKIFHLFKIIYLALHYNFIWDNFTKGYRTIRCFEKMILNYQTSQTSVSKFSNVLLKGILFGYTVKSCKNFQNFIFFYQKKMLGFICLSEFNGIYKNTCELTADFKIVSWIFKYTNVTI